MEEQIIDHYEWEAGGDSCDACQALNGTQFKNPEDAPDRPHPNCDCAVKEVYAQPCEYEPDYSAIDEAVGDTQSAQSELSDLVSELQSSAGEFFSGAVNGIISEIATWDNALGDFASNYQDMKEANTIGADKYFHFKANCEAAQRDQEKIAEALSLARELIEGANNVIFKGYDLIEQIEDAKEDMEANKAGRECGQDNPDGDCGDMYPGERPKGLPDKY